jgi:hypothetical protein
MGKAHLHETESERTKRRNKEKLYHTFAIQ